MKYKNNIMRVIAVFTMLFAFVGQAMRPKYKVVLVVPKSAEPWLDCGFTLVANKSGLKT